MAFIFPGGIQVGGNISLDTGSNIVLSSGSDIVLGEGANIEGQGDLDGNFSGSFTGSYTGSFSGVYFGGVLSSSTQVQSLGFSTSSADMAEVNARLASIEAATSSFLTTTGSQPDLIASASVAEFAKTASIANAVNFDVITGLPDNLVSSSTQIEDFGFITASVSGGVDYADIANKPTLVSSSAQISALGFVQTTGSDPNLVTSASFAFTASVAKSVDFDVITGLPDNLISSSTQISDLGFVQTTGSDPNLVASASFAFTASVANAVNFDVITGLPDGLLSSSDQVQALGFVQTTGSDPNLVASASFAFTASVAKSVDFDVITGLPDNLVSSSTQIEGLGFITSSVSGGVDYADIANKPTLVSSSQQISDLGFVQTTGSDPNLVASASFAFTASVANSVNFDVITGLPNNLISSSDQITTLGFITGSDTPGQVDTASLALRAERLEEFEDIRDVNGDHAILMTAASSSGDQDNGRVGFAGANTDLGRLKFNPNRGGQNNAAELTIGAVGVTGILDVDRIDMNANLIINDGVIDLLGVSNGGYIRFSNITLPNAVTNQGTLARNNDTLQFSSGSSWYELFYKESQIDIGNTTGNISGSRVVGDIQASSVDYANVLNKPTLFSSSAQIDLSSATGTAANATSASFATTASFASIAGAVDFEYVSNLPKNLVSSSAQITLADTTGNISGSRVVGNIQASSVEFDNVLNKPTLLSSSTQVDLASATGTAANATTAVTANTASYVFYDAVDTTGAGWVSGSAQINLASATGTAANATSASYASNAGAADSVTFNNVTNKPTLVSESAQIVNLLENQNLSFGIISASEIHTNIVSASVVFTSGSNVVGDEMTDTHQFTGSVLITGSLTLAGTTLISSSQQISDLGFVQTTGSDPNLVASASFAFTASVANAVSFDVITGLPDNLISSSDQVTLNSTTGNLSASRLTGTIIADSIDVVSSNFDSYQNLVYVDGTGNSKALKADSGITYNSSLNILRVETLDGTAHSASYIHYDNVKNKPALVSSSAQINLSSATGTAANATSASFATTASFATMAGAVDFDYVENLPDNLVSSSAQVDEFNSGLEVGGGNLKIIENSNLEFSASSGTSAIRYRTTDGGNKIAMKFDHDNDVVTFSNRASNGYFNFFANNATNGAAGERKVAEFRHNEAQFFQKISGSSIEVSGTITGDISTTTGNISGSRIIGDIQASSVEFDNVLSKPTLFSSSAQVNLASATGTAANATSASFATTASFAATAGAVDFSYVENLPNNLISSSQQVENTLLNNSVDFGTGTVTANEVHVSDRIRHDGDNDTSIVFQDNIVYINAGGRSNVGFESTITVINEDGHDHDFRVESKDIAHMLYVDGGNNRVAIGRHNPTKELDVNGDVKADSYEGDGALLTNVTGSYVDMDDIDFSALTHYDDDIAAAAGGVPIGKLYRNGNFIQVRLS